MDVDLLSKMLKELILDNDIVTLPGMGAFIAEVVPSAFSDRGYTINPPYRKLYFRSRADEDKLLVSLYAGSNGIDIKTAEKLLLEFTSELKEHLFSHKNVILPGLGRLRATKENDIFFIPDEDLDIYPSGFGLQPISLKTHQETPEEVTAAVESLKSIIIEDKKETSITEVPETAVDVETEIEVVEEPILETIEEVTEEVIEEVTEEVIEEESETIQKQSEVGNKFALNPVIKKILITLAIAAGAVVLFIGIFLALAHICPEFIDSILYTEEELRILNGTL